MPCWGISEYELSRSAPAQFGPGVAGTTFDSRLWFYIVKRSGPDPPDLRVEAAEVQIWKNEVR